MDQSDSVDQRLRPSYYSAEETTLPLHSSRQQGLFHPLLIAGLLPTAILCRQGSCLTFLNRD